MEAISSPAKFMSFKVIVNVFNSDIVHRCVVCNSASRLLMANAGMLIIIISLLLM